MSHLNNPWQGFSKLTQKQRYERLLAEGILTEEDIAYLQEGGVVDMNLANRLIENSIGYFQLPLGVATHFQIDGKAYLIPLAVEETSIIAALSKNAKWIKEKGTIRTRIEGDCILGQIQIAKIHNLESLQTAIDTHAPFLIEQANEVVAASMVKRGGGVRTMSLRVLDRPNQDAQMGVIHVLMNSCDAMGANILNQVLEFLKAPIENLTGETVTMCILSNLNDTKLTKAEVILRDVDPELGHRLQEASLFAEVDPYRAATHNKGVMNGIDGVLIATGNDWRAVEAGVHAYASRNGRYQAITQWRYDENTQQLTGRFEAPLIVGTVGGVTAAHPTARLALSMLKVASANELSCVAAAVGLVQNLGAIRALCTEGIIQGHMKLHIDNLLMIAGATEDEIPKLKSALEKILMEDKRVSLHHAQQLLASIRQQVDLV
jgi:hydroxymethylglutaryl-CoA reductase